jgi:microsomal dipeptidase-like Zn-dependent dipeptidase
MVMSHSNARALMDIDRNYRDESILAVGATGGAVCANYLGGFLNEEGDASAAAIARHVQHIAELIGRDKTCAGVDFVQNYAEALRPVIANPDKYPPEQGYGSETQMAPPADIWAVARVLEDEYGWTEAEIRGYLGENIVRVYRANWR